MSKPTLILIIILFLFTVGLSALALNKSSYNPKGAPSQLISPTPTKNPFVPDTSLLFGDLQVVQAYESATIVTDSYLLPIIINTGTNNVTVVQLELAFDPNILTGVNINPSSFFDNPTIFINQIDSKNGRISYALGIVPSASESGKQGEGSLTTLTFQTKTPLSVAKTSIIFLPKTFVAAEGLSQSALKSTNSAELKFDN